MKSFLAILRKYPVAMVMNFIGLALGFTAFLVLMVQVGYESSFDRNHPTSGRIYRVDKIGVDKDDIFRNILPRGYAFPVPGAGDSGRDFCIDGLAYRSGGRIVPEHLCHKSAARIRIEGGYAVFSVRQAFPHCDDGAAICGVLRAVGIRDFNLPPERVYAQP